MSILEMVALISTILCVLLSAREDILAWPVGIISALSLIMTYIHGNMYGQILLQSVFLIQCVMGWINWGKKDITKVNKAENDVLFLSVVLTICLGILYTRLFIHIYGTKNMFLSYIDGISVLIALLGNWYLTKKTIQAWPLFMVYNAMLGVLVIFQGFYLLAILNICLFTISLMTYLTWKRNLREV